MTPCVTPGRVVAQKIFYVKEVRKRCDVNNIKANMYFMLSMCQEACKFSMSTG